MELFVKEILNFLSIELTVLLTAALPIIELRGEILVEIYSGLYLTHATAISFIDIKK